VGIVPDEWVAGRREQEPKRQGLFPPGSRFTPAQADDASAAALDATGGGEVNSVERDDENGATWEVEVTKTDGTAVDVRLDESYAVVVIEGDTEDEGGGAGD
jgi:hypothetical protein